jgi:hypothetical protein
MGQAAGGIDAKPICIARVRVRINYEPPIAHMGATGTGEKRQRFLQKLLNPKPFIIRQHVLATYFRNQPDGIVIQQMPVFEFNE